MYRIHRRLMTSTNTYEKGAIAQLTEMAPDMRQQFVKAGIISSVNPPPLSVVPGWDSRSAKLAQHGILDIADFIGRDDEELGRILRASQIRIQEMKAQLMAYLSPGEPQS